MDQEERRHDPARRAAAKAILDAEQADLAEVEDLLARAMKIAVRWYPRSGLVETELGRRYVKIFSAHYNIRWWLSRDLNETYIGNMAARGHGWDERNDCAIQR